MNKKYLIILGISLYFSFKTVSIYGADYEYDDLGRVTKTVYEDGSSVTYTYDANGNIVEIAVGADDEDETENPGKNASENTGDVNLAGGEQNNGEDSTEKTESVNDLEGMEAEKAAGMEKMNQGLENEDNKEEILGKGENGAEEKDIEEKDIEETEGNDEEDKKGNVGRNLTYLAAAFAVSGTATVYLKNKQNRDKTKLNTETEMKKNEEGNHEK